MNMMNDFGFRARLQMFMMDKELKNKEIEISALKECVEVYKGKCKALEEALEVANKLKDEYRERWEQSRNHSCQCHKDSEPSLSKENFVDIIKLIQAGYARRNKLSDALEEINEGWFICNIGEEWVNTLISLLCFMMGDTVDDNDSREETIIEWWLYTEEPKILTIVENGESKEVDVTAPEDLYEYLISR